MFFFFLFASCPAVAAGTALGLGPAAVVAVAAGTTLGPAAVVAIAGALEVAVLILPFLKFI